jgi:hypothetical protein
MRTSQIFLGAAFVLAIGSAFTTSPNGKAFLGGFSKQDGINCTSGTIDQQSCPGGNKMCTISGVSPAYSSLGDCQHNLNVLKFQ